MECNSFELSIDNYLEKLRQEAFVNKIPIKGVFELTPRCNFDCKMCYVHLKPDEIVSKGSELLAEEWINIAKQAKDAGMLELTLTGGEPFIRKDFKEIYSSLSDMGFLIQIFTNGSLINEETISWLKKRPPHAVRITLYGAGNKTYGRICGVNDGFARVKQAVELLKREEIPLYLVSTITKENIGDLPDIYKFAEFYKVPIAHTMNLVSSMRGRNSEITNQRVNIELPTEDIVKTIRSRSNNKYPKKTMKSILDCCGNFKKGFLISWDGYMQLCAFLNSPKIDIKSCSFDNAWKTLLVSLEKLKQPEQCEICDYENYCDRCPGILFSEIKEDGSVNPEFCLKAKINYELYGKPLNA